jgi:ATP-dependent DNA helicase RecQ
MDPSLEDMTVQYPITVEEITKIYGVGEGKAKKYGKEFADFISKYVEDNNIERTQDMVLSRWQTNPATKFSLFRVPIKKLILKILQEPKIFQWMNC